MPIFHKKYLLIFAFLATQGIVSIIGGLVLASVPGENVIFPGVFIDGQEVGNLTRNQAIELVQRKLANPETKKVILRHDDKEWIVSYSQLGFKPDIPATVDKALRVGRGRTAFLAESLQLMKLKRRNIVLSLEFTLDESRLEAVLDRIASEIAVTPVNAGIAVSGGKLEIFPEIIGKSMNTAVNGQIIKEALSRLQAEPVELEVLTREPEIKAVHLRGINEKLGVGITSFSSRDQERASHIITALDALNGIIIHPGEVFSFNRVVGPGIREKDYREEPVMIGGRAKPDTGEGAGHVSAALYQAVLYAGLEVIERHAYAVSPGYVQPGQEAVVFFDRLDLKFKNTSGYPIYVTAHTKYNRAIVSLLGLKRNAQTVQVIIEKENIVPAQRLPEFKIKVFRTFYLNGEQERRELISEDDYLE